MKTVKPIRFVKSALFVLCGGFALATFSAQATLVTWNLNPSGLNQSVGSSSQGYTVSGYTITAYGYDNNSGTGTLHDLFYKNAGADEIGLGLTNILHNELQVGAGGDPLQFIQLDLTSILAQGFTGGMIEVGSVQSGEQLDLYGSNVLGMLGTKLNAIAFDSSKDDVFVAVPSFGTYKFISIVAAAADVLPVAFQATITPVPESTSIIPIALLAIAATAFEARRRRRVLA
jgi:hypothetical protein